MAVHHLKLDTQMLLLEMLRPPQSDLSLLSCLIPAHSFTELLVQWSFSLQNMPTHCQLLPALKVATYLPSEPAQISLPKSSGKFSLKDLLSPSTLIIIIVSIGHLLVNVYDLEARLVQGLDTLVKT